MSIQGYFKRLIFILLCTLIITSCENESDILEYESEISEEILSTDLGESEIDLEQELAKAGSNCKSNKVSRKIHARFIRLGKQRARANWSKKARKAYGWSYRKWSNAKDTGYNIEVRGTDFLLYKIYAYGKPCR